MFICFEVLNTKQGGGGAGWLTVRLSAIAWLDLAHRQPLVLATLLNQR